MNRLFLLLFGMVALVAHAQVPDYVPTEGLVAWYPLDGNSNDLSGNGHNGTLDGSMEFVASDCDNGQSLTNEGNGSLIIPSGVINSPDEITIGFRFRLINQEDATIFRHGQGGEMHCVYNEFNDNKFRYSIKFNDDNWYRAGITLENLGIWYSAIATYNSTVDSLRLYLSNGEVASITTPNIGLWNYNIPTQFSRFINGEIDDCAIWSRELSEEERQNYLFAWCNQCADSEACNFGAEEDCIYPNAGYNCEGQCLSDADGDGVCDPFEIRGCTYATAINYNPIATDDDGSCGFNDCELTLSYCGEGTLWSPTLQQCIPDPMCLGDLNGDGIVGTSDLLSLLSLFGMNCSVTGCVLPFASNYNAEASEDDWSCIIEGCADANALNYVPSVNTPADSLCIYSTTESTGACLGLSTLEYFGYHYPLAEIGSKCWFKENLRTSYFSDSTAIALADGNGNWNTDPEPASTYGGGSELTAMTFGLLYNWYAKSDSRGICPVGWHPADSSAWNEAIELAGGSSLGAPAMRVPGNQITGDGIWEMNNDNSTNATGFSALPAGYRLPNGNFGGVYATGQFWGGESISTGNARSYYLNQSLDLIGITQNNKSVGLAIRCVLQPVYGCTDSSACNFNSEANQDDGSCALGEYFVEDCMCWFACGDDEPIEDLTGPCSWTEISGCTDPIACNYTADVCDDDGSCDYGSGCCCPGDCNYPDCLDGDGVCGCDEIVGCTDPAACNYNEAAEEEDGSCFYATEYSNCDGDCLCGGEIDVDCDGVCDTFPAEGCTDPAACNFDESAVDEDGSCYYAVQGYDCDGNCLIDLDGDGLCNDISIVGCAEATACNYNASVTDEDGTCIFAEGCDYCSGDFDGTGVVIDGDADDDGVCDIDEISGCQDPIACNYNAYATDPYDEGCIYAADPCDTCSGQVDGTGTVISNDADGDGVCDADEVFGCTDPEFCCVYNEFATEDDGSCPDNGYNCDVICCTSDGDGDGVCDEDEISGCMDPSALNYDPNATDESGGCQYE